MSIGQVARESGVPATTLRYYEVRGILPSPPRRGGRRVYDQGDVALIRSLRLALEAGLSLKNVQSLSVLLRRNDSLAARHMARERLVSIDALLDALRRQRAALANAADCDCDDLIGCLSSLPPSIGSSQGNRP